MTPLSDALTAAQKRALAALEKAYVAGQLDEEGITAALNACGISDPVDIEYLTACLDVLNAWGAAVPAENGAAPKEEPMSGKQEGFIADLFSRGNFGAMPELVGVTKAQASDLINELQAGTYDPQKWSVPFECWP